MSNVPRKDAPMQDPFYSVKEEVDQSMSGITALYDRWRDLLDSTNTATSEEFKFIANELKTGVKSIDYDLQDLEETIAVVTQNRSKFRIEESEILSRKEFIRKTKQKVNAIKDELNSARTKGKIDKDQRDLLTAQQKKQMPDKYAKLQAAMEQDNENFIQDQKQRQQTIMRDQDKNLDVLKEHVNTLTQIGLTIDNTIKEHEVLIDEVDKDITRVDTGIRGAIQKVNKLIDSTKDSTQWCVIAVLFCVLVGMVVLIFLIPGRKSKDDPASTSSSITTGL